MANAADLKSAVSKEAYGFDPHPRHDARGEACCDRAQLQAKATNYCWTPIDRDRPVRARGP
jgi:hypothetical protein